jgi:hypothetical protein
LKAIKEDKMGKRFRIALGAVILERIRTRGFLSVPLGDAVMTNRAATVSREPKTRTFGGLLCLAASLIPSGLFAQNALGQVAFVGSAYGVSAPNGVVLADFNGDGKLDVATFSCETADVSIVLGNGDGTFGAVSSFASRPCGVSVSLGIITGDLDGDGKLDLATANYSDNTVSVLLGNGDGTFGAHTEFTTATSPQGIVVADFNSDGKLDLATANASGNSISILLGQGGAVFANHVDFPTGSGPTMVVAGDFNGDGKQDVAVLAQQSDAISILLGNGDGTFGPRTDFSTGRSPASLAKGDFNSDGILDLATANTLADSVSVLLGKGDGTFRPRTDLPTIRIPEQLIAADFNADGKLDLLLTHGSKCLTTDESYCNHGPVVLHLGEGNGNFIQEFGVAGGQFPSGVAAGDFNADGRLDLAISDFANDGFVILLQSPGNLLTVTLAGLGSGTVTSNPVGIDCAGTCLASFPNDTAVTLTATPANGSTFLGWSMDCVGVGDCLVTMNAAKNVIATFATPPSFAFGATPPAKTITAGQSAQFLLQIVGQPGFAGIVSFSCSSGLPQGAACSFNPASVSPGESTATTTLTITTMPRTTAASGQPSAAVFASLIVPLTLIFAPRSKRYRQYVRLGGLGIILVVIGMAVGCGGSSAKLGTVGNPNGTPAGTYAVTIVGASGNTNRTQDVTLVVN